MMSPKMMAMMKRKKKMMMGGDDLSGGYEIEMKEEMDEEGVPSLTVEVESEKDGEADSEEKDLAPGAPAEPEMMAKGEGEDEGMMAKTMLAKAMVGGLGEEEIMKKKGKLSLLDRIRQEAVKSSKEV